MRSFFTLLVLILVGISAYLYMLSQKYPWDFIYNFENNTFNSFDTIKEDVLDTLGNQSEKDFRAYHEALNTKNEEICNQIKSSSTKKNCRVGILIEKAKETGEESICKQIKDTERQMECENKRLYNIAIRSEKKYFCDQIEKDFSLQVQCSDAVDSLLLEAILKSPATDEKLCDTLGDSFFRECVQKIKKNKTEENYENALKAIETEDCDLYADAVEAQKCKDDTLFEKAKETIDVTICTEIQTADTKKKCLQQVSYANDMVFFESATENANLNVCDKIADSALQVRCKDMVLLALAQQQKSTSYCTSIQDASLQKECKNIES